ncbi:SDR family NAD(P)-dependent oxidoreductase [Paracoccus limosus]|jgi:NAD(P)-dependent dehydrogenase (short-subunit alcohol dehydrogenase family)|uniref:SDR family NAD(P)-dependent oxidoreductase n=1 Tax=Paracoccus limosus TaxID=913252 RepID=A0A844H0D9_9RHOB|nr:SDR family oxidoreductase [Paracoccus limosus]MTH33485.1 SDR family NAD(P)-dependent oxidoreductase [Paracoccus limosus]
MPNILITGAGSGIGRVTARLFLEHGWHVGLIGRREEALAETAAGHQGALVLPCDVTDPAAVDAAFAQAVAQWGRLDALFNNAGAVLISRLIDEISYEEWRAVTDVNISGMFLCARAAFRQMRRQDPMGGRIINNGSISADVPRPGSVPYTVSKHAVTGLTRTLSLDGRPFNIACGQIDIGNALTDMAQAMTKGVPQADGSVRVEPVMDATEVARAVWHMATMPEGTNIQWLTVMATNMPYIGRG